MFRRVSLVRKQHHFLKCWCSSSASKQPNFGADVNTNKTKTVLGLEQPPDPYTVTSDYIGPPDKDSNLRPYVRHIEPNETPLAYELRQKREEVECWNQDFWTKHNKRFYDEKAEFVRLHNVSGTDDISADRMSVFYKAFLDKNRKMHLLYNVSWYLKNVELLILAFQVQVQRLLQRKKSSLPLTTSKSETERDRK